MTVGYIKRAESFRPFFCTDNTFINTKTPSDISVQGGLCYVWEVKITRLLFQ